MPYMKKQVLELCCPVCDKRFFPKIQHPKYKYCSSACKNTFNRSKASYKQVRNEYEKRKRLENPELKRLLDRKRYLKNKEQFFENNAKRRYKIRNSSTPKWEEELTSFVFQEAQRLRKLRDSYTGIKWHVDHIIPICGKDVSGLHVWNNFAVIPKVDNLRKGNKNSIYA